MSDTSTNIEQLTINTIRTLSIDAIQKANSGHPGMPMGMAPIAYALYYKAMKHNPLNPKWFNRDRFILSAGHGSMLLYSVLHLAGYNISMDDIKNFRQWESKTPGHPEIDHSIGVETTTGPLGQGFATAIGMAIARDYMAALFNKDDIKLIDHGIWGICSDGDLMEGISHEAASLAGHLKLDKLVFFYDDNRITIDGKTDICYSDDVAKRFESYGWQVLSINDVNDIELVERVIKMARSNYQKPTLVITKTHIGFGSPNKQDKSSSHGAPLGEEEVKLTKRNLGMPEDKTFYVPEEVYKRFRGISECGQEAEDMWNEKVNEYKSKYPQDYALFESVMNFEFNDNWLNHLPKYENFDEKIATRVVSGKVLNAAAIDIPTLIGGSADLNESNMTEIKSSKSFSAENRSGKNIHFGIREHTMGAILNGMAIYGGIIPFGATFLIFSDYMRPAIRLAALMKQKVIYIFTHDSIGLGEDGPTHQPIEQLASLRAMPNLVVLRPADANETIEAWKYALNHTGGPVALILTRQKLPVINRNKYTSCEGVKNGAYIIKDSDGKPDLILLASGSEVSLCLDAAETLQSEGIKTRVVNFVSWEIFEKQTDEYKNSILPKDVKARLSVEMGVSQGWKKYVGDYGDSLSIEKFGASAPDSVLFKQYGFTKENIISLARKILNNLN
ncbi:MAG TPA: transketolase [Ignavibacteriaceae bacterium]|jgi:transketolase|nr:MAG: Transketolase [Ignavibacteria bacterium ADurb.Bin266]OQY71210.1 MAG: transketolase [Ignavibacteriales bacterium UTCHB2]HQF41322.1 transketolase [Ignavibacteriaceae bacterium]HQI40323.1 transketolase [Ignavibacteriaceae bacterium]